MKSIYLIISIAIMLLIHGSFGQSISTTDIPSQGSFLAGTSTGSTPSTMTPSQGSFQAGTYAGSTPSTMTPFQGSFQAGTYAGSTPSTMTPFQGSFEIGMSQKSTSTIQTPSQMAFARGYNESTRILTPIQTSRIHPTQMYNINIVDALKEDENLHVLVANNGTSAADLANWKLVTDNQNLTFIFPIFTLMPSAIATIHAHEGTNSASDLYGSNFIWDGTHEIKLYNNNGLLVSDYRIGTPSTN